MAIISSLLDLDFYKLTMGQYVFHRWPDVPVRYGFTNRTKSVWLADVIDIVDLRRELDHVLTLRFTGEEIFYLRRLKRQDGSQIFREDYLAFLATVILPSYELRACQDGQYKLEFPGKWRDAIYWETIALSIINELYYRATVPDREAALTEGRRRLQEKIDTIVKYPDLRIIEFGTRRRYGGAWQREVLMDLIAGLLPGQLLGTSNVMLAKETGQDPSGTIAHETFMALAAILFGTSQQVRSSHNLVLREWWDEYGEDRSIALTDTFGSSFFFKDMTQEQARLWRGLRHDSGDPLDFGEQAIRFYQDYGIDPKGKLLVFSDGLDLQTILKIRDRFHGRINISFGWGTNLTNDLGYPALSLVVKVIEAAGHGTVKLSDNLAKAQGDPALVEWYKEIFGHTVTTSETTRY